MTRLNYIFKSFIHYLKANLLVALGVAVSTTVLTGSLIIGDSVRYSLEQTTFFRLGETTHLVAAKERYFRQEIAGEIEMIQPELKAAPVLLLEGLVVADGGKHRVNRVQVIGVDSCFEKIAGTSLYSRLEGNEIVISRNLAERLKSEEGANLLIRVKKASLIPMNAPFVSDEETSVSLRATVKKVLTKEELGRFNLKNAQTAPYNLFLSLERLNQLMDFSGKANHLLISTEADTKEVKASVDRSITPADAGLLVDTLEATGEIEISTTRVFMESEISKILEEIPEADPMITYFVDEISLKNREDRVTPYSFVSTLGKGRLNPGEILLTQWAADDLGASSGDTIRLTYKVIGPLRKLTDKHAEFVLKGIVPMTENWADSTRMPWIPGLSDAGHCREWEAGVPIDLDAIRDKDEDYWDQWGGAPKAYISLEEARQMWRNRFGTYTAVRFPAQTFDHNRYESAFSRNISSGDLGILIEPVREEGLSAARSGTDFSGLFLGLSFFLLAASVVLTALLFRLNLETRSAEVGILSALGFRKTQVRRFFLLEGFIVAFSGGLLGLALSVIYTSAIFNILNTVWFEIVRTNMLFIRIYPATLLLGLVIGLTVSLSAVYISIFRYQRRQTADLQKRSSVRIKKEWRRVLDGIMGISLGFPVLFLVSRFVRPGALNTSLFFLSGGLLLAGLLLVYRKLLFRMERSKSGTMRIERLSVLNLTRNTGRSLTIVILFALGTFLVVSTGSNKQDLFARAEDKSSGTGGFLYFAETTMPVLFDLNSPERQAEEGIYQDFKAVQFRRVEGDDASCLNLNRIKQPAILGVDPEALHDRFSFATRWEGLQTVNPWEALEDTLEKGAVPAIADQTVIQWGLGKKVGDELFYQNEKGDTLKLRLIAGTKPSVFQGYVIISNDHFLEHFPSNSGSHVFLIGGEAEETEQIKEALQSVFRDYGWQMESTAKRLVEFYSVTNTYLSIFLVLGALGLILGTIGLAVILARTLLERRREIGLMQALGFRNRQLFRLLLNEYLILLFAGVLIGFIAAVVATMPAFLSANADASPKTVLLVVGLILANGFIWIAGLSWFFLRRKNTVLALKEE